MEASRERCLPAPCLAARAPSPPRRRAVTARPPSRPGTSRAPPPPPSACGCGTTPPCAAATARPPSCASTRWGRAPCRQELRQGTGCSSSAHGLLVSLPRRPALALWPRCRGARPRRAPARPAQRLRLPARCLPAAGPEPRHQRVPQVGPGRRRQVPGLAVWGDGDAKGVFVGWGWGWCVRGVGWGGGGRGGGGQGPSGWWPGAGRLPVVACMLGRHLVCGVGGGRGRPGAAAGGPALRPWGRLHAPGPALLRPRLAQGGSRLSLDFGSLLGPLFYSWLLQLLLPVMLYQVGVGLLGEGGAGGPAARFRIPPGRDSWRERTPWVCPCGSSFQAASATSCIKQTACLPVCRTRAPHLAAGLRKGAAAADHDEDAWPGRRGVLGHPGGSALRARHDRGSGGATTQQSRPCKARPACACYHVGSAQSCAAPLSLMPPSPSALPLPCSTAGSSWSTLCLSGSSSSLGAASTCRSFGAQTTPSRHGQQPTGLQPLLLCLRWRDGTALGSYVPAVPSRHKLGCIGAFLCQRPLPAAYSAKRLGPPRPAAACSLCSTSSGSTASSPSPSCSPPCSAPPRLVSWDGAGLAGLGAGLPVRLRAAASQRRAWRRPT